MTPSDVAKAQLKALPREERTYIYVDGGSIRVKVCQTYNL